MTPEAARFRAEDAKQLLDNPLLIEAFVKVGEYLEAQALSCEPDNPTRAHRIVTSKQLLAAVRREMQRVIEEGELAQIRIAEVEKNKKFKFMR